MNGGRRATVCWIMSRSLLGAAAVLATVCILEAFDSYKPSPWGTHAELTEEKKSES